MVHGYTLRKGTSRSCGCLQKEMASERRTHGHSRGKHWNGTPTYLSWRAMKVRCTYAKHQGWKNYGGRGIKVCDRWLNSFENFLADMKERPKGTTLDRYPDNNGNYEPGNCRWATPKQQRHNQSTSHATAALLCKPQSNS